MVLLALGAAPPAAVLDALVDLCLTGGRVTPPGPPFTAVSSLARLFMSSPSCANFGHSSRDRARSADDSLKGTRSLLQTTCADFFVEGLSSTFFTHAHFIGMTSACLRPRHLHLSISHSSQPTTEAGKDQPARAYAEGEVISLVIHVQECKTSMDSST
jgi:hypothetical protein